MLSKYLNFPLGLGAIIFGALAVQCKEPHLPYLIFAALACVIGMIGLYFFSDVIDWKWYKKNPPTVEKEMRELLSKRLPFYQNLSEEDKAKFETRVELYVRANEFIPNGWEHVPYDIQAWVAVNPVMLTFHQEDFLLADYERVVIYPHSFPSPQYPEQFHCSEVFAEDGVLLFSTEKLLPGVMQPRAYFNIGIYEYAKVYKQMNPFINYPEMDNLEWLAFERIVNYTRQKLETYIGLTVLDQWGVLVTLFFSHPKEMEDQLLNHFTRVKEILNY
jgi:uncharacterized protein YneF (UPF0154 family)